MRDNRRSQKNGSDARHILVWVLQLLRHDVDVVPVDQENEVMS